MESRNFKQLLEKMVSGVGENGWTREGQTDKEGGKDRKSHLGFGVIVDEGRETERSELQKKQNLYVDPRQREGYCGGRIVLSLR